jgi:hypothetical protein
MPAQRSVLVDPAASSTFKDLPAGITVSEHDYLEEATVDSTQEAAADGRNFDPK